MRTRFWDGWRHQAQRLEFPRHQRGGRPSARPRYLEQNAGSAVAMRRGRYGSDPVECALKVPKPLLGLVFWHALTEYCAQ